MSTHALPAHPFLALDLTAFERNVVSNHVGTLSIVVAEAWRDVGIGSALYSARQMGPQFPLANEAVHRKQNCDMVLSTMCLPDISYRSKVRSA